MTEIAGAELKLSGSGLSNLMQSVLRRGASFRFRASGFSMTPFIRDKDVLTVSSNLRHDTEVGDVVAAVSPVTGRVIVHRVVRSTSRGVLIKGDNCGRPDGLFARNTIAGVITSVERNGKKVRVGCGFGKKIIALLSGTGLLNWLILPVLRTVRGVFPSLGFIYLKK